MSKQYNYSKKTGRPTKYNPAFIQSIDDYLDTVGTLQHKLPKRVDIALLLDVDEETLSNWGKDHPEFFAALMRVDGLQKAQLMDDGMYGGKEVNDRIAKFLLSANHGMAEKSKQDITTDGEKLEPIQVIITEAKHESSVE
jgi:hypothetical protein